MVAAGSWCTVGTDTAGRRGANADIRDPRVRTTVGTSTRCSKSNSRMLQIPIQLSITLPVKHRSDDVIRLDSYMSAGSR